MASRVLVSLLLILLLVVANAKIYNVYGEQYVKVGDSVYLVDTGFFANFTMAFDGGGTCGDVYLLFTSYKDVEDWYNSSQPGDSRLVYVRYMEYLDRHSYELGYLVDEAVSRLEENGLEGVYLGFNIYYIGGSYVVGLNLVIPDDALLDSYISAFQGVNWSINGSTIPVYVFLYRIPAELLQGGVPADARVVVDEMFHRKISVNKTRELLGVNVSTTALNYLFLRSEMGVVVVSVGVDNLSSLTADGVQEFIDYILDNTGGCPPVPILVYINDLPKPKFPVGVASLAGKDHSSYNTDVEPRSSDEPENGSIGVSWVAGLAVSGFLLGVALLYGYRKG